MRAIGTIPDEAEARRFTDYLLTRNITARLDARPAGCVVWVHREEQVDEARRQLDEFRTDPGATRYQGIDETARALRKKAEREEKLHVKNSISLSGRWDYRPARRCPLTLSLIVLSAAVGVLSQFGSQDRTLKALYLTTEGRPPAPKAGEKPMEIEGDADEDLNVILAKHLRRFQPSEGLAKVRGGEVWRLVTPIFIHFGVMHFAFNMFMLYDLGGLVELRKGTLRLLMLVLASAIISNLAQYEYLKETYHGAFIRSGGMSGVVYAIFGFVWMTSRHEPAGGMGLRQNTVLIMMVWLVLGFSGALDPVFGHVGNVAHLAGLLVGVALGIAPHWRAELRRWT